MRAVALETPVRELLPEVCRTCSWWQTPATADDTTETTAEGLRREWEQTVEAEVAMFGRLLLDGDETIGWLQAAPAHLVARARRLPPGPPATDAHLLMCAYFHDDEYLHGFQYMLHDLVAALKHHGVEALEAYALRDARPEDRFRGYLRDLNLFNPQVLTGSGFRRVAGPGAVGRYRLELATLIDAPRRVAAEQRPVRPATLPA